jgi:uncharacterized protein (DUF952 family)
MYVYRVLRAAEWQQMLACGEFVGSGTDESDGYIHLSTREQVAGTITAHFGDVLRRDLIIVEIDAGSLRGKLRWEASRAGALFPHLYGLLPLGAVTRAMPADRLED